MAVPNSAGSVSLTEFNMLKEKVAVLNGERAAAEARRALRYSELGDVNELIASLREEADAFESTLSELGVTLSSVSTSIQALAKQNTALSGEVDALTSDVADLAAALGAAEERVKLLQDNLDGAQKNVDAIANNQSTTSQEVSAMRTAAGGISIPAQTSGALAAGATVAAEDFNKVVSDLGGLLAALSALKSAVAG